MSYGRRKTFTDEVEITAENVVKEINAAFLVHTENRNEIANAHRHTEQSADSSQGDLRQP